VGGRLGAWAGEWSRPWTHSRREREPHRGVEDCDGFIGREFVNIIIVVFVAVAAAAAAAAAAVLCVK